MFEEPVYVATIIMLLLAVGEVISIWSKAWIPSLLIILAGYLVLLWAGVLPADMLPDSTLAAVGSLLVGVVITHMGTLIPLNQIRGQYKAVLIALIGITFGAGLILLIVSPILGYASAVAGAGPVTGGIIAYIVTAERLTELGLQSLVVIPALILGLQKLTGLPLANVLLRKYAIKLRDRGVLIESTAGSSSVKTVPGRRSLQIIPEKFQEPPVLLFLLFVSASLATWLDSITGLNYGVWALAIGLIGRLLGIFPEKAMQKANAFGLGIASIIVVIMASISTVTFEDVVNTFWPAVLILTVGATGIMAGGWIASKLFKWDPLKGMPVALTALFGFPADYLLCQEVSRSVGRDEGEQKALFDELVTPMLVGGFTTVTTASIVIASILVGTI
ncbi:hypothetical protein [Arthrobacter pigmenti]